MTATAAPTAPMPLQKKAIDREKMLEIIKVSLQDNRIDMMLQPVVSLPQRKSVLFECFSRLRAKDGEIYTPKDFMHLAEEEHLMSIIDNTMLFRCIKMIRLSLKRNRNARFFCNVSAYSLADPTFANHLLDFLGNNTKLAKCLIFEFQADLVKENLPTLKPYLRRLKLCGCSFSMDQVHDFDINLLDLQEYNFEFIKLPLGFLTRTLQEENGLEKIQKFIDASQQKQIHAIIDHVENEEGLDAFSKVDFQYGQGYLFGKPTLLEQAKTIAPKTIEIIATGSKPESNRLEVARSYLTSQDHSVVVPEVFFDNNPLYVCGDQQRFHNLKNALCGDQSDVVWCLRGGYGTSRLLPKLLDIAPPKKQKAVMGFSDVTALHLFLTQKWGWKTIHGPTINALMGGDRCPDIENIMQRLANGKFVDIELLLTPLNPKAYLKKELRGSMTGGNLTLVQSSIGTPWQVKSEEKILFLEDVNEEPYRVAERFDHLMHAGIFKNVKAILLGHFTHDAPKKNYDELLAYVLLEFAKSMDVPVFKDFSVGHIKQNNPIQMGGSALLTMAKGKFVYKQTIRA